MSRMSAAASGNVVIACPADQPNGNIAKRSLGPWRATDANLGVVLSVGDIVHPMVDEPAFLDSRCC